MADIPSESAGILYLPETVSFPEDEDDHGENLIAALVEAMTAPPCCPLFGITLHHHWRVPRG